MAKKKWRRVDLQKEGLAQAAAYSGVSEVYEHVSGQYTLARKTESQLRGGRRCHVQRWWLRRGMQTVHEVMPCEDLRAAMDAAEEYIAEAEAAAREMAEGRVVQQEGMSEEPEAEETEPEETEEEETEAQETEAEETEPEETEPEETEQVETEQVETEQEETCEDEEDEEE